MRSELARSTPEAIYIKGLNLCEELMGKVSMGDMLFMMLCDRLPEPSEARVFDAVTVTLVEHGITPSALSARLTYAGAPEAMQAAVAAGICGLGSVFVGSMEDAARMLQLPIEAKPDLQLALQAQSLVDERVERGEKVPGVGHHFHKPHDPRAVRLFKIGAEQGLNGHYVSLMQEISLCAERRTGKVLPVNATGAIAALGSELGIDWTMMRGIGIAARTIGLLAHLREEARMPMARELKEWAQRTASAGQPGEGATSKNKETDG